VEGLTRKYNTHILITEFTLKKIKGAVQSGDLYRLKVKGLEKAVVKGKEKPVEIHEIRSLEEGKESVIIELEGKKETVS